MAQDKTTVRGFFMRVIRIGDQRLFFLEQDGVAIRTLHATYETCRHTRFRIWRNGVLTRTVFIDDASSSRDWGPWPEFMLYRDDKRYVTVERRSETLLATDPLFQEGDLIEVLFILWGESDPAVNLLQRVLIHLHYGDGWKMHPPPLTLERAVELLRRESKRAQEPEARPTEVLLADQFEKAYLHRLRSSSKVSY
jgi:hypothetical protein